MQRSPKCFIGFGAHPHTVVSGEDMRHPTEDGIASRNTPSSSTPSPSTEDTADSWPGGYEHPRSHTTTYTNTYSSHVGSRTVCSDFGVASCECCNGVGVGAKVSALGSGIGVGATRARVGSEARHRRRFVKFEEANLCSMIEAGHVGTVASHEQASFSEASIMICNDLRQIFH